MKCINCGHDVSEEVACCPACGSELQFEYSLPHREPVVETVDPFPTAEGEIAKGDKSFMASGLRMANTLWALIIVFAVIVFLILT